MAGLLEQAAALRLRLLELAGRVGVRLREQLARLVARGVQHLGALALALLAVALELRLAILQLALPAADLFLGLAELRGGGVLRVALDRVGELGGGADEVQRVHADGVAGRLDGRAGARARGLEHAQLRLQLGGMAAERVEGVLDPLRVEAVPDLGNVLVARQGGQRRGPCAARTFDSHLVVPLLLAASTRRAAVRSMTSSSAVRSLGLIRIDDRAGFRGRGARYAASESVPR